MQSTFPLAGLLPREPHVARAELRALNRLALPLVFANVGQVMIGVVDTAIVGRLGAVELGGAGLGNSIYFTVAVFGLGLMSGLDPLLAQAFGAKERDRAWQLFCQGAWLAVVLSLPLCAVGLGIGRALEPLGIDPKVASGARDYLAGRVPGLLPLLLFFGARSLLQAANTVRHLITATALANVVNLVAGLGLAFGDRGLVEIGIAPIGLPSLGVLGVAIAGSAATLVQLLVLFSAARRLRRPSCSPALPHAPSLLRVFRLGAPIGGQMLAEFSAFALVHVLVGVLDGPALAGHQLAITLASATFMVPLALGNAASVRVGRAVGSADTPRARLSGLVAIGLAAAFMTAAALALFGGPRSLARLFTDQPDVLAAAVPLLLIAAVFQISDGVQAVAAGALRGAGDTRIPLMLNLLGHYGVGLPAGVVLAHAWGLGARGLWWGLSIGLACVAIGLTLRFVRLTARPVARV
jgi:multidrug resistance protein, MATE family